MTESAVSVEIRGNTECGVMKLRKENTFFFLREWSSLPNFAKR